MEIQFKRDYLTDEYFNLFLKLKKVLKKNKYTNKVEFKKGKDYKSIDYLDFINYCSGKKSIIVIRQGWERVK